MSNTFYDETQLWLIDETGTLNAGGVTITKIVFHAANAGDSIVITDNADKPVAKLICPSGNDFRQQDFGPRGKKLASLKVASVSGGSTAYIHFRTDI